jgi:uncharacterized membrane protein
MAMELIRFLAGVLVLIVPGICVARALSLGNNFLERFANGSALGLAFAVYLASAVSYFDLRWFYPLWIVLGILAVVVSLRSRPKNNTDGQVWMWLILCLVACTRFAVALPMTLPAGTFDPTFHLILARKIQITHHAINDWSPFANVQLNYPTGSHVLVVILAAFCRLPLETTYKNLIPFLGVLTTAQVYVFSRRITGNLVLAIYSAGIYGLWAWYGSIDYFRWGGLPNELAMLLFLAMLSLWLDHSRRSFVPMAVLYASAVLAHHHVMVVSGALIAAIALWQELRHKDASSWKTLIGPVLVALGLAAFFLFPFAMRMTTFHSTGMVNDSEPQLPFSELPWDFGYVVLPLALAGIVLCLTRVARCHSVLGVGSFALVILFVVGEDIIPLIMVALDRTAFTFFTPSRFLADLNYFLPIFAAIALGSIQQKLHLPIWIVMLFIFIAPAADFVQWKHLISSKIPPSGFIQACQWIQQNTPPDTIVDNTPGWTTYLTWRRAATMQIPVSEPAADFHPQFQRIPLILSGRIPPDRPGMIIVAIREPASYTGGKILWQDPSSGALVVQEWPK